MTSRTSTPPITSQATSTARARIIANLKIKKRAVKAEKNTTILPKFLKRKGEAQEENSTAEFISRAEKLSCKFLPAPKVIAKNSLATTLATYLKSRYKNGTKKNNKKISVLIDGEQKKLLANLNVQKKIEPYCNLIEVQEIVDFATTPFPPLSIQQADYAIAETGSLVFLQNTRAQAALSFLPTRHIVLLDEKDLLPSLEQAFARSNTSKTYWACLTISGPSRTADIEQELHLGAHGPKELLIILYR